MSKKLVLFVASIFIIGGVLAGCAGNETSGSATPEKVVIGYFPNINHAAGMIAESKEIYKDVLGEDMEVEYRKFPDGSAFMTALKTGDIHAGLVGPGPAMNNYMNGANVNIVAAGSTGGTVIVAREGSGIETAEDIEGQTFVSPRVGCTHDVQFETYMKERGITSKRIDGTMTHETGAPAQYITMFKQGRVDVATAPEPWGTYLVQNADANVVIPSTEISFGKTLPAAVYAVNGDLAENNPDFVQNLVNAHKQATDFINENPEEAKNIVVNSIKDITDAETVVHGAWENINFTYDVNGDALQDFANSSYDLEFLTDEPDLSGLVDKTFIQ